MYKQREFEGAVLQFVVPFVQIVPGCSPYLTPPHNPKASKYPSCF